MKVEDRIPGWGTPAIYGKPGGTKETIGGLALGTLFLISFIGAKILHVV